VATGPVHATLQGPNHAPTAGKLWHYTVRVTDASGKPLDGSVETEFTFAGQVVGKETPPIHRLRHGVLHDAVTFPADAVGHPLALATVVRTSAGSVALGWPVSVHQ
jgi:hypothetical protein